MMNSVSNLSSDIKSDMLVEISKTVPSVDAVQQCANIWLQSSCKAHDFIAAKCWQDQYQAMCEIYLPQSEIYLATVKSEIIGFAAIVEHNTLAALFVHPDYWRHGIGKQILSTIVRQHSSLQLTVYAQNKNAINFYIKQGFKKVNQQLCAYTGHEEWQMFKS